MADRIPASVASDVKENKLTAPGQRVLVALSGGPDSVALLDILHRLSQEMEISLGVAHLHHGLRGREADGDQEFCRRLAKKLGLPFHTKRMDVKSYAQRQKLSLETAAREVRRAFLKKVALKCGYDLIATGHTANDQAETVLMHLIRGCGPDGLAGIGRETDGFIRPLLGLKRQQVLSYLRSRGLSYRIDRTNLRRDAFRNRIRLDLLPHLERYNPKIIAALCRLADNVRNDRLVVAEAVESALGRCLSRRGGELSIDLQLFKSYNKGLQKNILRELCRRQGGPEAVPDHFSLVRAWQIAMTGRVGARVRLAGDIWARREYNRLVLGPLPKTHAALSAVPQAQELRIPGRRRWNSWLIVAEIITNNGRSIDFTDPYQAYFDWEKLQGEDLFLRPIPEGARMRLYGSGHTRKVQDILIDAKIPREQRRCWPAVFRGRELIWLGGLRRSPLAPISRTTKQILKIKMEPYGGKGI